MCSNKFIATHYYRDSTFGSNGRNEFITIHYHRDKRLAGRTVWNALLIVIPTKGDFLGASADTQPLGKRRLRFTCSGRMQFKTHDLRKVSEIKAHLPQQHAARRWAERNFETCRRFDQAASTTLPPAPARPPAVWGHSARLPTANDGQRSDTGLLLLSARSFKLNSRMLSASLRRHMSGNMIRRKSLCSTSDWSKPIRP